MILLYLLWAFFIANLLGYGGGPASIPLMFEEVVSHFGWLSTEEFSNMLALANALPGPVATKIAAYVGFGVGGWGGFIVALAGTIVPSAVAVILLLKVIRKHRTSPIVKGISLAVQPVIAMLMVVLTLDIFRDATVSIGWVQSLVIAAIAFCLLQIVKLHPAFVILLAFAYGGVVIPFVL
ncbi:chromate transporter [Shouchella shacheensis]|uniref:chromate transporter n=1 Tax=Shouchella shacheensis TaxID=1649580 RepID=UPI00074037DE|nr:chromate transporter [Shouchella shacheensis]